MIMTKADLLDTIEGLVRQFGCTSVKDGVPTLWTGGMSALEGAFDALGWEDHHPCPEHACNHPGCQEWATCGIPTPDGYQRLCGKHYLRQAVENDRRKELEESS